MDKTVEWFVHLLGEQGIEVTSRMQQQFDIYYKELVTWNEKMNLTGITARDQVYLKHFYDSVTPAFFVPMDAALHLCDVGSGAGFPSIPLKILYPHLKVTIIDSLNKRIQFLTHIMDVLQLSESQAIHARAEEAGRNKELRGKFDLVTARAVARLNVLNELCIPFVKVGGSFIAMKGTNPQDELTEAAYSMKVLGTDTPVVHSFRLPLEESERHIIVMDKVKPTPQSYPRTPGTPAKKPLIK